MVDAKWTIRTSRLSFNLGIAAIAIVVIGVIFARYDLIPKIAGLYSMMIGGLIALIGLVCGLFGVVSNLKSKTQTLHLAAIGLVLSSIYVGYIASRAFSARGVPPLHDITTNVSNPPMFVKIVMREDILAGVESVENWREVHRSSYSDLESVVIAKPVETVIASVESLARKNGWEIALVDPPAGHMEATASVSLIRYQDDIVVRVVETEDGQGSIVDMRSVSRIGVGDFGVNAARIRSFLKELTTM